MSTQLTGKILVVDDSTANRYVATRILKTAGHQVLEAATATDGIAQARQSQPDVILLDVKLPDMVGFEATELLKSEPDTAHIPILQMSASYTSADAPALGLQRGADAYLTMPVEPQVLLATVNAMLRLHRAERELQESVRSRDDFLSIASHDLRTPLTSIQLSMDLIIRSINKTEEFPKDRLMPHLMRVSEQAKRLGQMLESLLDISKVRAGIVDLQLEPVDLGELARETLARYHDQVVASGSEVHLSADSEVIGHWDRLRLEQVIANLLSNAIKYGNGKPIELSVIADGDLARLVVRDRGVGIAEEQKSLIFKRFERAQRERRAGSYGLGLWIVQRVVDAFGGSIRLESTLGQGATFTVELPRNGAANDSPDDRIACQR